MPTRAQRLVNNDLQVTDLAPGATVVVPHLLREINRDTRPDLVLPDKATPIRVLSADDTTVTFKNEGVESATAVFMALRWHTIQEDRSRLLPALYWQGLDVDAGPDLDEKVKVTANDTTPGFLDEKIIAGTGLTKTVVNPGGDEDYQLDVGGLTSGEIDTDVPIAVRGATNAEGISASLSRADHDHRLELEVNDNNGLVGARPAVRFLSGAGITVVVNDDAIDDEVEVTVNGTVGAADGAVIQWGNQSVAASADSRYLSPGSDMLGTASTSDNAQLPLPRAGTVKNLHVRHNGASGNGNNVVYTVFRNGVATALTCSLATGVTGQTSDLVNTVGFNQGDRISIQANKPVVIGGGNIFVTASVEIS